MSIVAHLLMLLLLLVAIPCLVWGAAAAAAHLNSEKNQLVDNNNTDPLPVAAGIPRLGLKTQSLEELSLLLPLGDIHSATGTRLKGAGGVVGNGDAAAAAAAALLWFPGNIQSWEMAASRSTTRAPLDRLVLNFDNAGTFKCGMLAWPEIKEEEKMMLLQPEPSSGRMCRMTASEKNSESTILTDAAALPPPYSIKLCLQILFQSVGITPLTTDCDMLKCTADLAGFFSAAKGKDPQIYSCALQETVLPPGKVLVVPIMSIQLTLGVMEGLLVLKTSLGAFAVPVWGEDGARLCDDQGQPMTELSLHTVLFFHNPFEETLIVTEVLLLPATHSCLVKESEECKKETDCSVSCWGRCAQGCFPSYQTSGPQKPEPHESPAIADFHMELEMEVDFRGWEQRLNISHDLQRRSWHNSLLIIATSEFHTGEADSSHPSTPDDLNLTVDLKHDFHLKAEEICKPSESHNVAAVFLGSRLGSSSELKEDHHRGAVEANSTWNLQLEAPLLHNRVLSAPTEAQLLPLPSLTFVRESADQEVVVQELAAAEVTEEGSSQVQWQQVNFEGFQRRSGTRKYLSAADLSNLPPPHISVMSTQADKPKELDLLDVSAFVFLPVVLVCFWMLTFSNEPLLIIHGCNGASSSSRTLDHTGPFLRLGLIWNKFSKLIDCGAFSTTTIVDNVAAATMGLAPQSANAHSTLSTTSTPNLPHIRVKLSKSPPSSGLLLQQRVNSVEERTELGRIPLSNNNHSKQKENSGKKTPRISSLEIKPGEPPDHAGDLQAPQVENACSMLSSAAASSSSLSESLRKGTSNPQEPQLHSHPVYRQPASTMDKEKRRRRKKKGGSSICTSSSNASSVNHDASSNPGSSGASSPSFPSSPRTPASVSHLGSPLSPFESRSERGAHLGDPTSTLVQEKTVDCSSKQVKHRMDAAAGWSASDGNDSVGIPGTSSSMLASERDHKSSSSRTTKLSKICQWDRGALQQPEMTMGRPTLLALHSFPGYGAGCSEIGKNLFVDQIASGSSSLNLPAVSTNAPLCRAPGAKSVRHSLSTQCEDDVLLHDKSHTTKLTIPDKVCGVGNTDSNLYDIWGNHFGEFGCFNTLQSQQQQPNDFGQGEKALGLSRILNSANSGSLFSNLTFEICEASSCSEANTTHVSSRQSSPLLSSPFSVFSNSSSLGLLLSSNPSSRTNPPHIAETSDLRSKVSDRSTAANMHDACNNQCLATGAVSRYTPKSRKMPAPYNPPMGGNKQQQPMFYGVLGGSAT